MSKTRVSIPFSQRGPIPIHLEDSYSGSPTGCAVIDVIFPQGEEVSEVRFRNSYTAWLTVLVKFDQSAHPQFTPRREMLVRGDAVAGAAAGQQGEPGGKVGEVVSGRARMEWVVAVKRKNLMENPHYETGSQDEVVILASESKVSLEDVTAMRFILRQPSPEWRTFSLEEISVYKESLVGGSNSSNPTAALSDSHSPLSKLEILRRHTMDSLKVIKLYNIFIVSSLNNYKYKQSFPLSCFVTNYFLY